MAAAAFTVGSDNRLALPLLLAAPSRHHHSAVRSVRNVTAVTKCDGRICYGWCQPEL